MSVTQGPDDRDIQSIPGPLDFDGPQPARIKGMKLALSMDLGCYYVDPEVEKAVKQAAAALRAAGAAVERVKLPWTQRMVDMWMELWQVFMAAYFGHTLGKYRDKMDPAVVSLIEEGNKKSAADYKRLEIERTQQWNLFRPILAKYDALLCPTMAIPAPKVGIGDAAFYQHSDDGLYHGLDMTCQFNSIAPCPALSVPAGWSKDDLPIGLQIVARRWRDDTALTIGKALEKARPWAHRRPPI
jgi:Asp-tRNA(Asn)/Glu-tRNA(Gln) amidotransferase A subunit family amidase